MKFCPSCGASIEIDVPAGDTRPRHICRQCDSIHYQNPKIVAGCLPVWQDKVLLCRRAIHPRHGFWTLPAGFMENDETLEQAAIRESIEEANASLEKPRLYTVVSLPHINQVYMMYLAQLISTDFYPGTESLETQLFNEASIPWESLAFATIRYTLHVYFQDRELNLFDLHTTTIDPTGRWRQ